jgi:hypothetical protein
LELLKWRTVTRWHDLPAMVLADGYYEILEIGKLGPGDVTSRDSEHKGVSGTLLGQFNLVRLCQTEIL